MLGRFRIQKLVLWSGTWLVNHSLFAEILLKILILQLSLTVCRDFVDILMITHQQEDLVRRMRSYRISLPKLVRSSRLVDPCEFFTRLCTEDLIESWCDQYIMAKNHWEVVFRLKMPSRNRIWCFERDSEYNGKYIRRNILGDRNLLFPWWFYPPITTRWTLAII